MPDIITLSCPSCGHKLQITQDIDRFACAACGNEHIVNRSGGIVTLKPVIEGITRVQVGVDKTASELAIVRLEKENKNIEEEIAQIKSRSSCFSEVMSSTFGKLIIFMPCFFAFIGIVASTTSPDVGATPGIVGVIVIIIGISLLLINNIMNKGQDRINKEEAQPLVNQLYANQKELAAHKSIVSRFK